MPPTKAIDSIIQVSSLHVNEENYEQLNLYEKRDVLMRNAVIDCSRNGVKASGFTNEECNR